MKRSIPMKLGLGRILNGVGAIVTPIFEGRNKIAEKKLDIKLRTLEAHGRAAEMRIEGVQGWEHLAIQQTGLSRKDEWWTLFFIGVLLLVALPWTQEAMERAFIAWATIPSFIQAGIVLSFSLSFGAKLNLGNIIPWGKK